MLWAVFLIEIIRYLKINEKTLEIDYAIRGQSIKWDHLVRQYTSASMANKYTSVSISELMRSFDAMDFCICPGLPMEDYSSLKHGFRREGSCRWKEEGPRNVRLPTANHSFLQTLLYMVDAHRASFHSS